MKKILIVDDNQISLDLALIVLKDFDCDIAYNGKSAIELYHKNKYDIILMDLKMPIMDGVTVTKIIRKFELENNIKKTKIFALTASNKTFSLSEIFDDFIIKPYNLKELIRKINK